MNSDLVTGFLIGFFAGFISLLVMLYAVATSGA